MNPAKLIACLKDSKQKKIVAVFTPVPPDRAEDVAVFEEVHPDFLGWSSNLIALVPAKPRFSDGLKDLGYFQEEGQPMFFFALQVEGLTNPKNVLNGVMKGQVSGRS